LPTQNNPLARPLAIIVIGVAGSGKSTVGRALADALDWSFIEGDDYHPQSNADKLASGSPLTGEDRYPWLKELRQLIVTRLSEGHSLVLSCSAPKKSYRQILRGEDSNIRLVFLRGEYELIESRMRSRPHPYMRPEMLPSQFEALEEPTDAIIVDISRSVPSIVD
jgi:carbohydrate kinase (thermoresistant glucokinase family)